MKIKPLVPVFFFAMQSGCMTHAPTIGEEANRLIPAEEFSKMSRQGNPQDFSIYRAAHQSEQIQKSRAQIQNADQYAGDERYLRQGLQLKRSIQAPATMESKNQPEVLPVHGSAPQPILPQRTTTGPTLLGAPGSYAPYALGQMTSNPSLWPDEAQGAYLFSDFRAIQALDVITIMINESSEGKKKAETDSKSEFSLLAGIKNLFGLETQNWTENNSALDPEALISATTTTDYKGEGETKRQGTLKGRISAVVMEVLPNGLLRLEGTKILSLNSEEEVMVISGLVRPRDVTADNQVDSSRIANMRIDFYGRGILGQQQSPGWGVRVFETIWPF